MDSFRSAGLTDGHGICGLQFLTITVYSSAALCVFATVHMETVVILGIWDMQGRRVCRYVGSKQLSSMKLICSYQFTIQL